MYLAACVCLVLLPQYLLCCSYHCFCYSQLKICPHYINIMRCNKIENVRNTMHNLCFIIILHSIIVTADIDKALLCTENAVEVALDVREIHHSLHTTGCLHIYTCTWSCCDTLPVVYSLRSACGTCGIVLTVVLCCHVNGVWPIPDYIPSVIMFKPTVVAMVTLVLFSVKQINYHSHWNVTFSDNGHLGTS